MDKRKIGSIIVMALCLGIFFFTQILNKSRNGDANEVMTGTYQPGSFKDQGEMWDYLHAHSFKYVPADSIALEQILTVKNYELFLNGEPYSAQLEVSDFQYVAAGLSGYDMKGKRLRIVVQKDSTKCVMVDITDSNNSRLYKAVE